MATYKSIRYSPLIGPGQVLLKTITASSSSDLQFTQGITSEYKEYLFVAAGFHPEESNKVPQFQVSTDGGSSYGVTATTAFHVVEHAEDGSADNVYYQASQDIQNGTGFQSFAEGTGNENDSCMDGYLHIYNPAGTTHVKLFHTSMMCQRNSAMAHGKASGYFNTTNAINAVKFQLSSGNIDAGTISMYGLN